MTTQLTIPEELSEQVSRFREAGEEIARQFAPAQKAMERLNIPKLTEGGPLQELVNKSRNFKALLANAGYSYSSQNIRMVTEHAERLDVSLDFPDRYSQYWRKVPNDEVFIENSPYTNNRIVVKDRALDAGYVTNVCALCGQLPEWNGKPLVLQLDHQNGKNDDHRPENLRILCPNCHTQTETYAGKRRYTVTIEEDE